MKQVIELEEPTGEITSPRLLFDRIRRIEVDHSQENFLLFSLNTRKQLIAAHVLFKGGRSAVCVDPATVFRRALLDNADAVVVAHNHPSGCLSPSDEDEQFARRLAQAGDLLTIPVLDNVIFNAKEYFSFVQRQSPLP